MLKPACKHLLAYGFRLAGPPLWPLLRRLPRVGHFAEVLALYQAPLRKPIPACGTLLHWPLAAGVRPLPDRKGDDVPPAIIQKGQNQDWSGKRVAIMAHWDANGEIAAYVRYYAQKLREAGFAVILASSDAVTLPENGADLPFAGIVYRPCPGYDFSSWKAALLALPSLFQAEELLLTNDSIFAPVGELAPLFSAMRMVECDFWGLIESHVLAPHLQSFFVLLRRGALAHPAFHNFWKIVGTSRDKQDSIDYETYMGLWLAKHGLRGAARFPLSAFTPTTHNPSHYAWNSLLQTRQFPFIKRELLFRNPYAVPLTALWKLLAVHGYPASLIREYAQRNGLSLCHK